MKGKAVLLVCMAAVLLTACGTSRPASGGQTAQTAQSAETAQTAAAQEPDGVYTNEAFGIRIVPGDNFKPYKNADAFSKVVRGKKWERAFGKDNHYEFGYAVTADAGKGYFYGYSMQLTDEEKEHDLSDFASAAALQVTDGEASVSGTKEIGDRTYYRIVITGDDGAQEIVYLTKNEDAIMAIVIGQMQDAPIEDACLEIIGNM